MDLLGKCDISPINSLEEQIPPSVSKLFSCFRVYSSTKEAFLQGVLSILKWYDQNQEGLHLLNRKVWTVEELVYEYFVFLKELKMHRLNKIEVGSVQWEWFIAYVEKKYGLFLLVDDEKVREARELERIRKFERQNLKVRNMHRPLDSDGLDMLSSEGGE